MFSWQLWLSKVFLAAVFIKCSLGSCGYQMFSGQLYLSNVLLEAVVIKYSLGSCCYQMFSWQLWLSNVLLACSCGYQIFSLNFNFDINFTCSFADIYKLFSISFCRISSILCATCSTASVTHTVCRWRSSIGLHSLDFPLLYICVINPTKKIEKCQISTALRP